MKKVIVYSGGLYASRLLTMERYRQISYFVDDIDAETGFEYGDGTKNIYPLRVLEKEDKDNIIIVVSDEKIYPKAKEKLEKMGFLEDVHFFSGWRLNLAFYKSLYGETSWDKFEKEEKDTHSEKQYLQRAKVMAEMIPEGVHSVMDLGCGAMHLKSLLPDTSKYYGVDYCKRNQDTIVCDLNSESIPDIKVDLYYMAGLLYYIDDIDRLVRQFSEKGKNHVLFDYGGIERYLRLDGVPSDPYIAVRNNYLSAEEIFSIFIKYGYSMDAAKWDWKTNNLGWHIYRFHN